ncbi:ThiF family adenylyltransferase [Texcoconibacillus texcoconensis]|nr:ThiF family adenylyltransferase [Texcoconibacillus texcoconensis]
MNNPPLERYNRQMLFFENGEVAQQRLMSKHVAIVGIGATGSVLANHLTRSGVGELTLIDRDIVEKSNLQRQMLFNENDAENKTPKAIAAKENLTDMNRDVKINAIVDDIRNQEIETHLGECNLILDGTDNMDTRFLINDISVKYNIPWIYGGVVRARGMTVTVIPGKTPCFRCLFPEAHTRQGETCDTVGVINTVVDIIASYQATEALKWLSEETKTIREDMLQIDVWENETELFPFQGSLNPECPCCQKKQFSFLEKGEGSIGSVSLCGRNTVQILPNTPLQSPITEIAERWRPFSNTEVTPFLIRTKYRDYDISLFANGRMLVQGTDNQQVALQVYNELTGIEQ